MDEPASALDPASTSRIEDLIFDLKKNYTIVIVTHNMQQAARVSDMTAFFYQGKLVEMGDTRQMFTNPSDKQTEDYITGRFGWISRRVRDGRGEGRRIPAGGLCGPLTECSQWIVKVSRTRGPTPAHVTFG